MSAPWEIPYEAQYLEDTAIDPDCVSTAEISPPPVRYDLPIFGPSIPLSELLQEVDNQ